MTHITTKVLITHLESDILECHLTIQRRQALPSPHTVPSTSCSIIYSEVIHQLPFLMRVTTLVFYSKEISSFNVTVKYGDMTDLKDYVSRGKKTPNIICFILQLFLEDLLWARYCFKHWRYRGRWWEHVPSVSSCFLFVRDKHQKYNCTSEGGTQYEKIKKQG